MRRAKRHGPARRGTEAAAASVGKRIPQARAVADGVQTATHQVRRGAAVVCEMHAGGVDVLVSRPQARQDRQDAAGAHKPVCDPLQGAGLAERPPGAALLLRAGIGRACGVVQLGLLVARCKCRCNSP
jgi:hypothetical protein